MFILKLACEVGNHEKTNESFIVINDFVSIINWRICSETTHAARRPYADKTDQRSANFARW